MKKLKSYLHLNSFKTICLILIVILGIIRLIKEDQPYASGDGIEYTLMTEAFFNHFSFDVRPGDCESFKQAFIKNRKWEENYKGTHYDEVQKFIERKDLKNLDSKYAFYNDREGKKFSVHFWTYPLLNLPVRWLCHLFPFNPIQVLYFTNFLLIIISCFIFLRTSKFGQVETGTFCFLFFFSTNYWYFCWPHPEVFTVCFTTLGLWMFIHDKKYTGILLTAIAATQNQPLAMLTVTLSVIVLFEKGFNIKNLVKLFFSSVLILMPPVFYYYHFGTMNLIGYQGALKTDYITWTRVFGFFFDINQGMILALPLILLIYLFLYFRKLIKIKNAKSRWDLWLFPCVILVICSASTIDNWNHGQAVVNRYVTYVSAIVLLHFFYMLTELENKNWKRFILFVSILTQTGTVFYHQALNQYDWSSFTPKPISKWVLSNFPALYNPDPVIFNSRYGHNGISEPAGSPTYFMKENGEITKFLLHRNYLKNLQNFGYSSQQIDSLIPLLKFDHDWAYVTVTKELTSVLSREELKRIDNEKWIAHQIRIIKGVPSWYEDIKIKAQERGVSEYKMLRENAAYVLHIDMKDLDITDETEKAMEESIAKNIERIKATPSWLKSIEEKAKAQNIPLDSAIYIDAKWLVEQEKK
jgi:hypothetical protein